MAPGKQQVRRLDITVSSGTGTGTLTNEWTIARWIRVHPIAETDTFDVTFKDANGDVMVKRTGNTGTVSEMLELSLGILRTVLIESASQDGTYRVNFDLH